MGRKLDLSGLTDTEAEHVLQVVQRDMRLRKKEEERLSELKQELDEEGSRCLLLSRQSCFNRRCCIRCCSPFTFLLNPKRLCRDCHYNVCKACCVYNKKDKAWLCSTCQKTRSFKTQSLEWFYTNVKNRFKRFGSAKVLKTLYRKHLAEHSALSELTEGSAYEESICNEGSICGSDSTFYRQTEEHSMEETLTVALRVAEEAIDEAISKAEFDTDSQEKQNEANYLREHRGELIEELAKTIVQKIINRRKTLAEMRAGYDHDWPLTQSSDTDHRHHHHHHQSASGSMKQSSGLWRSQSAFSLLDNDSPVSPGLMQDAPPALQKEGGGSALSTWKSVDRLDNAGVSAVLKSPDGNWIALQSTQLSRPSLLTQRKSLVYSALERESGVVSAYEGMDSDDESRPELDSSWGAALQEIHRKMTDSNFNPSPMTRRRGSRDDLFSDSEGNWKQNKPLLALLKSKVPAEIRRPSSSRRTSIIDVNFNVDGAGDEERVGKVRRSRKKRKSKKEAAACLPDYSKKENQSQQLSDALTPDTLTSGGTTPEPYDLQCDITGEETNQTHQELTTTQQETTCRLSDSSTGGGDVDGGRDVDGQPEEGRQASEDGHEEGDVQWRMEVDLGEGRAEEEEEEEEREEEDEEEMKNRLYRLVAQSRLTYFSSTDDELDRVGLSGGEGEEGDEDGDVEEDDEEQTEEKTDRLSYKLCRLEKEVRASQFSSTEDELDRVGVMEEEEDGKDEELAVKVCRLVNQVNATQFSSTEDELDRAGRGEEEEEEEEAMEEDALWKLQAENAIQAARVRDLAGLVSASQFSSSEDQLDRFEESEREVDEGGTESSREWEEAGGNNEERRESFGDLDVNMFDLKDEIEERESEKISDGRTKDKTEKRTGCEEERETEHGIPVKGHVCEEKVSKEVEETREMDSEAVVDRERTEEIIAPRETKVQQENQPEAKWTDKDEEEEGREEKEEEEEEEEEDIRESKESQGKWEEEEEGDSDEEDEEFDRIISSMLMMTLEDMQGETFKDEAAEHGRTTKETDEDDEARGGGGGRFEDTAADAQEASASEDTGSTGELQSRDGNVTSESAVEETLEEEKKRGDAEEEVMKEMEMGGCEGEETEEKHKESTDVAGTFSPQDGFLSPEEIHIRYSASSLRSITTEVLKVLNATEELLQGVEGGDVHRLPTTSLPPDTDPNKLDQQFARLEENVYVAAGAVYGLEAELSDLEECARGICSATSDMELSFLEEQVASAAAKVQQSDLQICDISARIAALKTAGLNVDTQCRFTKTRTIPVMPVTLDSSRQLRRRLPAPPVKDKDS